MTRRERRQEKIFASNEVYSPVSYLTNKWNRLANDFIERQSTNPFSDRYCVANRPRWIKGTREYATPVGKTAERGEKAQLYITKQIDLLCQVIAIMGQVDEEGRFYTTFGELFQRYTRISSNVVGLLIRARKRQLVEFPGEMLWQRRDDHVIITLNPIFLRPKV